MKYFVSRHHGALEWAHRHGIEVHELIAHFDPSIIHDGDLVIGTLPINIVAEVNRRGGEYIHLSLNLPVEARGKELTADDMDAYGASLKKFWVSTDTFSQSRVTVCELDESEGQYGPNYYGHEISTKITQQGAILKLTAPESEIPRDVYIERLPESWRINISLDGDDIDYHVEITDDDEII